MSLACPRCDGVMLEEIELDSVMLDRCPRCAGLWFDSEEIAQLAGRGAGVKRMESTIPGHDEACAGMECPRCPTIDLRRLSICAGGAVLYRCASCSGTWMDRGELRHMEDEGLAANIKEYISRFCEDEG